MVASPFSSATFWWMPSSTASELSPFCSRTMPSTTSSLSMSLPSCFSFATGLPLLSTVLDAWVGARGGVGFADRGGAEAAGLANLAEADLRPLDDRCDVFDAESRAVLGLQDGVLDVVDVAVKADFANIDLLLALLDEVAAGVDVVVGDLLLDLADGQAVGDEFVRDRRGSGTRASCRRSWKRRRRRGRT